MAEPAQSTKQRVLIVDDSRIVRTTIARLIRNSFDVREEADGEAGWQAVESDEAIMVVISDLSMPKLDGFGLIERIRASQAPRVRNLPVIMISGNEDDATKQKARAAGANDFITKSTDGTEILSRIDNLLRLVQAKHELQVSREVITQTATHDPLTGTFTPHYLVTEGGKHFSHARRHGGPLSVVSFRIDSHAETTEKVGKEVAEQLLARVAKQVLATLRAEDSMGRTGEATFSIVSASTSPQQAVAFARRLGEQLDNAKVNFRNQVLRMQPSIGISSLGNDSADSIEDLMRLSVQRLQRAAQQPAPKIAAHDEVSVAKPLSLPSDVERAVQVLEYTSAERLGDASIEVLRRLLPFFNAAAKQLNVDLPVDKIMQALKSRSQ
jgi:two-component system cell cycle response regulator